jgi:hypothetical protein
MAAAAAGGGAAPAAAVPSAITVPPAFKKLVVIVAGMFYSGQCPPAWWVDAADPKKDAPDAEHAMFQQEKKAAQIAREVKRKAQVRGEVLFTAAAGMHGSNTAAPSACNTAGSITAVWAC